MLAVLYKCWSLSRGSVPLCSEKKSGKALFVCYTPLWVPPSSFSVHKFYFNFLTQFNSNWRSILNICIYFPFCIFRHFELRHTNQWATLHQPMSYATPTNELRHTNQWATQYQPMSYATQTNELRHTNQWATPHQPMSYTTPTNELRRTSQWAMPHQVMSYVTSTNELWYTNQWAMPH